MAINCFAMPLTGLPTRRMRFNCASVAFGMSEKSMVPELFGDGRKVYEDSGCDVAGRTRMRPGSTVMIAPDWSSVP
jgi:hypothetical protein